MFLRKWFKSKNYYKIEVITLGLFILSGIVLQVMPKYKIQMIPFLVINGIMLLINSIYNNPPPETND